jgi:hypothetical protein
MHEIMTKTVWERLIKKTDETTNADGTVTRSEYAMFVRMERMDGGFYPDGSFNFAAQGTFPPFERFPFENPNPINSKKEAQLFTRKYLVLRQQYGWTVDPHQSIDDWD